METSRSYVSEFGFPLLVPGRIKQKHINLETYKLPTFEKSSVVSRFIRYEKFGEQEHESSK